MARSMVSNDPLARTKTLLQAPQTQSDTANEASRAAIMGIINTTPDSFSDGGQFELAESAIEHGRALLSEGADILDIGGESTRPGAKPVSLEDELKRVIPVIRALRAESSIPLSIDTSKPEVMSAAVDAGATFINDVNALQADGALECAAQARVPVCLMHMQGDPSTMQNRPEYDNVVDTVIAFLEQRLEACQNAGLTEDLVSLDPGIGFGKSLEHNLALLKAIPEMRRRLGCPILIGVSRKSLIDHLLNRAVDQRLFASVGLAVQAAMQGAQILRVHDVRATYDAVRCAEAVQNS